MKKTLLIISFLSVFSFLHASPSLEPSVLTGLESSGEVFKKDLTPLQIIKTAVAYSLCPPESEEGRACIEKYKSLEAAAKRKFSSLPQKDAAEKLLYFMYESALYRYRLNCAKISTTFVTGEYNCVTASILYLALAKSLGIQTEGQLTELHAFCSVYINGQKIDVETTNPHGFNPGERKTVSQTANSKKYATVPKKYYAGRREVSDRAMATLTGKNIASDLNDSGDFETAIPLDVSRYYFLKAYEDPEVKNALDDLDTLTGNYVIELNKQKKCGEAVLFLDDVSKKFGVSAARQKSYDNSVYNGTVNLINSEKERESREFFETYRDRATPAMQTKLDGMITTATIRNHEVRAHNAVVPLFNSMQYQEAKKILEKALKENPDSQMLKRDLQMVNRALGL